MHSQTTTSANQERYWRLNAFRDLEWAGEGAPPCYYCGDRATGVDHILPRSRVEGLDAEALLALPRPYADTVPCCNSCNTLLNATYQDTLTARKQELKVRLRKRWRRLIDETPEWTEDQLNELADGYFRDAIIAQLAYRDHVLRRLRW